MIYKILKIKKNKIISQREEPTLVFTSPKVRFESEIEPANCFFVVHGFSSNKTLIPTYYFICHFSVYFYSLINKTSQ